MYLIKDNYLSEKLIKHNIECLLYYKYNILYYILLIFQINKYPELSVQALKLELPMFNNHFNSQSLNDSVYYLYREYDQCKILPKRIIVRYVLIHIYII